MNIFMTTLKQSTAIVLMHHSEIRPLSVVFSTSSLVKLRANGVVLWRFECRLYTGPLLSIFREPKKNLINWITNVEKAIQR